MLLRAVMDTEPRTKIHVIGNFGQPSKVINCFSNISTKEPSGHVDVQRTPIERPYWTCGRPKGTFNGRLVDVPNETQLVRPNRTKMDVHFRPLRDAMHGTWTSSGLPPDIH